MRRKRRGRRGGAATWSAADHGETATARSGEGAPARSSGTSARGAGGTVGRGWEVRGLAGPFRLGSGPDLGPGGLAAEGGGRGDVATPGWLRVSPAAGLADGGATSGGGVLAGHRFRGEEVGGGWHMIGGTRIKVAGWRRPKLASGGVYIR